MHCDEFRMRIRPDERLPLGLKKTIDYKRVPFDGCPAGAAGRFTIDHGAAGIDRGKDAIGEDDFAAIRNPARIDRAMSDPQSHAGGAFVPPRISVGTPSAAGPINGDACQQ